MGSHQFPQLLQGKALHESRIRPAAQLFQQPPDAGGAVNFNPRGTAIPNEAFAGNLTGYSFASYLLGIVDSAGLQDPVGLGTRRKTIALFFQDDFKVSSRLTLQIGLRWEYQPPFVEVGDRLSSWNPQKTDPISGLPALTTSPETATYVRDDGLSGGIACAILVRGLASLTAPEKWVVRGAYGIVYSADLFDSTSVLPLGKANSVAWGGTWNLSADPVRPWAGIFNLDNGFPQNRLIPGGFDVSWGNINQPGMMDPNYGRSPYIQEWNLNVQRELGKNLVLDVGYVGNKATGLREGELNRINQLPASALTQYGRNLNNSVTSPAEAAANGVRYPFPGFRGTVAGALKQYPQVQGTQTVRVYGSPLGFSHYQSLQVTLNKQFTRDSPLMEITCGRRLWPTSRPHYLKGTPEDRSIPIISSWRNRSRQTTSRTW